MRPLPVSQTPQRIDLGIGAYPGVYILAWLRAPQGRVHERRGDNVHTHAWAEFRAQSLRHGGEGLVRNIARRCLLRPDAAS